MTTATARADLSVIKARQQKTWASGDYAVIASRIVLASELLEDGRERAVAEGLDVEFRLVPATYLETILTLR
jgi:hypothetical protein